VVDFQEAVQRNFVHGRNVGQTGHREVQNGTYQ
jgi:hypothetical protein